jgi:Fibronectin type III domain
VSQASGRVDAGDPQLARRPARAGRRSRGGYGRPALVLACVGLLPAPLLAGASADAAAAAEAPATFGKTSVGASSDVFASNRKRVNEYSLPVAGSVSKLSVYLAPGTASGQQLLEGILYANASGKPGNLLGTSSPLTFSSTNAAGWYELNFPTPLNLTAGSYWIGVFTGETGKVAGFRYDSVGSSRAWNSNTYTSGPSNPFGAVTTDSEQTSLYATYTPSSSPLAPPSNTAPPTISGTAAVGQTLSASTGTWSENPTRYEYQWQRCDSSGASCAPIFAATTSTYTVSSADVGSTLRVSLTASNSAGSSTPASSAQTAVVPEPVPMLPPSNTAPPTISGTAAVGQTLSASTGSWSESPTRYEYQWQHCDTGGANCAPISGAIASTYTVGSSDVASTLRVAVTAANAAGSSIPSSSAQTAVVPSKPSNTAQPTISGTAAVGQTLSASTGTWSENPTRYEYQWQRCDSAGANCGTIGGATASNYPVGSADVGSTLRVSVTASNSAGSSTPASSAQTAVVQQVPATFGKTSVGSSSDVFAANRKRVSEYSLPVAGSVSKLSVYLAPIGSSGQQVLEGILYANASGKPGGLLGTTVPLTFSSTNAAGWYDLSFGTPLNLAAGSYWIGVITGEAGKVAGFRYDPVASSRDWNANTYTSGPSNPFGAVTTDSEQASLYATYTAGEAAKDTTLPTIPQGLTATAVGSTQIDLSWSASSDDVGVTGYTVRRNGAIIATTGGSATSYADSGLSPSTTYTYTVDAFDAAGNHSTQSTPASSMTLASSGTQHYEYVFPSNAIDVYDMDNGQKLIRTIPLPAAATDIRGAAACPSTHILYASYGHDSSASGGGFMLAYDLLAERTLWTHSYAEGIDSMANTPDCKMIYMPVGEASSASSWNVLEASTGNILSKIEGGAGPHNTIVSLNGERVYMGPRNSGYLTVAETATNKVIKKIGPLLNGGVRPFTINGKETLAFTTATGYLGFQVSSITSGQVLYTVPVSPSSEFPYTPGQPGPSSPSHGISLSPDEKEVWVIDQPNSYVHVYDITGLPGSAPTQVANIKLTRQMTGTQVGCTYDCLREGWLQHSLDGRYLYVGDSGDVIDTKTRQSIANLEPLYNSRVFLEVDWSGGVPVATSTRSGVGYVTH